MVAVLGIDAAWTQANDSGFALVEKVDQRWRLRAAASDLRRFVSACGVESEAGRGTELALRCAERVLAGRLPDLVAVDMPMSRKEIKRRRVSDDMVSIRFGAAKCATHSPSERRPGKVGERLQRALETRGYSLVTSAGPLPALSLAEVYPHPALLTLMSVDTRFCYKVNKSRTYWPEKQRPERLDSIKHSLRSIVERLEARISGVAECVGDGIETGRGFSALKSIEDMIASSLF